jgi:hypothetical protein
MRSFSIGSDNASARNEDIYDEGFIIKVSEALGITLEEAAEAININQSILVISGNKYVSGDDGDQCELFNLIKDKGDAPQEIIEREDAIRTEILSIDEVYKNQQDRSKPLLSGLLTVQLIKELEDVQFIEKVIPEITFIDYNIYNCFKNDTAVLPAARDIAAEHGVSEQSASRTFNVFLEKVKGKG